MPDFRIRTMTRAEVDFAVQLAASEGWNPGLHDAECFYAADPEGFLVGLLDGTPIGTVSAVQYGGVFGFLGFYVVLPEYRKQHYGMQLANAAVQRLKDLHIPTIAADGVLAMVPKYETVGFVQSHGNIRHEGQAGGPMPSDSRLLPLGDVSFDLLHAYDTWHFGVDREAFLRCWVGIEAHLGLALLDENNLHGYGVVRPCGKGWKIGPLFARTPADAELLFNGLSSLAKSGPLYLDTPAPNAEALALAARHGMQPVFETARIHMGPPQRLSLDHIYGVTSFELG